MCSLPTAEQRLATVARIARSLAIFCVDEVIVYNDGPAVPNTITRLDDGAQDGTPGAGTYTGDSDPCHFLAQVLSFLECPPFMRRRLFPLHPNLKHTALLPPVDMPHHPGAKDPWLPYREGVTIPAEEEQQQQRGDAATSASSLNGTLIDAGLDEMVRVADVIPPNTRVTLHFDSPETQQQPVCAHPEAPRTEGGYYWGYAVRVSATLSGVFTECPHAGGYDLSVGTSDRGTPLSQMMSEHRQKQQQQKQQQQYGYKKNSAGYNRRGGGAYGNSGYSNYNNDSEHGQVDEPDSGTPSFKHLLVVFGGPRGIELAAANDPNLADMNIRGNKTRELFDHYVNVLPNQGSKGISTDEAVPIALMGLRGLWEAA